MNTSLPKFVIRSSSFVIAFVVALATAKANPADPQISNLTVRQDDHRVVHVSYTLDEAAVVTMDVLTNGVSIGGANIQLVVGDCFKSVAAGTHSFQWHARESWPDQKFNGPVVTLQLKSWATDAPPDILVVDLETKAVAYYQSMEFLPDGGLANDKYRTSHLVMKKVHAAGQTFTMGSPTDESNYRSATEVQHSVAFTKDYYLAIYETTLRQFVLMGCEVPNWSGADQATPYGTDDANQCPIGFITYNRLRGAAPDIDWPTTGSTVGGYLATIRTATGLALDLPTEAQWEFACRAGTTTALYSGQGCPNQYSSSTVPEIAWYYYNSDSGSKVHAVGGKPANDWGFYDMCGNVQEWCLDWYGNYDTSTSPVVDPPGSASEDSRIFRGGHFGAFSPACRSAARGGGNPRDANAKFGFRLCLPLQ